MPGHQVFFAFLLTALIAVPLGGCSTSSGVSQVAQGEDTLPLSPEERELREHITQKRVAQSAVTGCLIGGAVGGAAQLLTGRNAGDALVGAGVGCVVGGVVGAATGAYVDSRAQAYANDQERLTRMAAAAREDVVRYKRTNEITKRLIAKEKERIAELKRQVAAGNANRKEMEETNKRNTKTIDDLTQERQRIDDIVATIDRDSDQLKVRGANVSALSAERAALITQSRDLTKNIETLNGMKVT